MTGMNARMAALEAVAEAARDMQQVIQPDVDIMPRNCREPAYLTAVALSNALGALDALDALPAQPAVETVEVRAGVYWDRNSQSFNVNGIRWPDGTMNIAQSSNLIAIITARVPLPTIPTIPATVEPTP